MTNTFNIPIYGSSDTQFRKQVIDALDQLAAGTGLADNSVTLAKLQQIGAHTMLNNTTAGTANVAANTDVGKWGT